MNYSHRAVERADASDFGPESDAMVEGLRVLVRSANEDADLNADGDEAFAGIVRRSSPAVCRSRTGTGAIRRSTTRRSSRCSSASVSRAPVPPRSAICSRRTPTCAPAPVGGRPAHSATRHRHRSHRPPVPRRGAGRRPDEECSVGAAVDAAVVGRRTGGVPGAHEHDVPVHGARRVGEDTAVRRSGCSTSATSNRRTASIAAC